MTSNQKLGCAVAYGLGHVAFAALVKKAVAADPRATCRAVLNFTNRAAKPTTAPAMKKPTHGGRRKGAGAKPKDPEAGNRVMISVKVHPDTRDRLRQEATDDLSQGEIIDQAVAQWSKARNRAFRIPGATPPGPGDAPRSGSGLPGA